MAHVPDEQSVDFLKLDVTFSAYFSVSHPHVLFLTDNVADVATSVFLLKTSVPLVITACVGTIFLFE